MIINAMPTQVEMNEAHIDIDLTRKAILGGGGLLKQVPGMIEKIIREKLWSMVTPRGRGPFTSFADFMTYRLPDGFDCTFDKMRWICKDHDVCLGLLLSEMPPLTEHGNQPGENNTRHKDRDYNVSSVHGNSSNYLISRLARDNPEMVSQIGKGKRFKSARAAGIAAGIVKVPTPLENARKAVGRLNQQERRDLIVWLNSQG
jgi:hypothetical protein